MVCCVVLSSLFSCRGLQPRRTQLSFSSTLTLPRGKHGLKHVFRTPFDTQETAKEMKQIFEKGEKKKKKSLIVILFFFPRAEVWAVSGKKGVYPLLFQGDNFLGDMAEVENLNEIGELAAKLGNNNNAPLVPMF